jgi:purine-binding chemotaxis protein CheW
VPRKRKSASSQEPPVTPDQPAPATTAAQLSPAELHARLQSLRPRDEDVQAAKPRSNYLTFWIAGDEYALPLARAREIVRCESITRVPHTPPWLRGVTNIRGSVIPVVDLAPRLGCDETLIGPRSAALLIEVDWTGDCLVMGLLVDAVGRVASLAADAIDDTPSFGTRMRPDLLQGLIQVDQRFALVLNVDAALSASELLPRTAAADETGDGAGATEARETPAS